jgi:hypothetical protein
MLEELVRDDEDDDQEDDERRRRSIAGAAVFLTVLAVMVAWLIWPKNDQRPAPSSGAEVPGGPSEGAAPVETGANGCPAMPSGDEIPAAAPPVTWEVFNGAVLPVSQEHGPAVVDGAVARCYSRTPAGALIAAAQIGFRILVDPDGGVAIAREQTVAGEGQDALVAALRKRGRPTPPQPGELCQIAGYRFVAFTPQEAVIALASDCGDKFQLTESRVQWSDGDWRRVLEPDGSTSPTASVLPDLEGMTLWSGV